ncbi:DUF4181 domain-containing protein [Lysinibacillus sp. 54212]|uniref:DUF4181 domain-containing protein n=1 Tax=Lysinibacillus sp. 54212 TaxID=3119829 RepID=UPI002FCAE349
MEFIVLILVVIFYQILFIPILKHKIDYLPSKEPKVFYDYKTKWQLPFEIGVIVLTIVLILLLTPALGFMTIVLVPVAFIAILVMRGFLERKYIADMRHHIISFVQAFAIAFAFIGILIYALIFN